MIRITYALSVVVSCILLIGCSTQGHLDFSLFNNVSPNRLTKVKAVIKNSEIQNFELPTVFPYPVTSVNVPNNGEPIHPFIIYFGDSAHAVEIDATQASSNAVVSMSSIKMQNESETKLADGTKALYGNNGWVSELAWYKNNVFYSLSSSNNQNKSDLTEQQLIDVASSFK